MSSPTAISRFRRVQSFEINYGPCKISQYVSERSGMQVVVADLQGPKLYCYFNLATEIFDDSGAPHPLEHLIFMGSKSYQYKGILDKLSSRAYSDINALTATTYTAYTLDTAGWDSFAQILPVYLEHILLPNITDESITTEVWHIDGEGNDGGVIYSEIQARQFRSDEIMELKARRLLYPKNVGYRYQTGVIVGETNEENLLRILDEFEESIKDEIPPPDTPFKRPWMDSVQPPALAETKVVTAEFPEDDETLGEILVGFHGPNYNDIVASFALPVLFNYLSGSSTSILERAIVEHEELGTSVSCVCHSGPHSVIWLQCTGVPAKKLEFVEERLFELLIEIASK